VFVLVQDAADAVTSVDVQLDEPGRIGDRFGQRREWSGVGNALVGTMGVVATRSRTL